MEVHYSYASFSLNDIVNGNSFKIPQFQRNVVWNYKKRKEFIDTLRKGNPFGSILVHQEPNGKYALIDGLQRISTIKNYNKNPFDYYDYADLDEDLVKELIKYYYEYNKIVYDPNCEAVIQETQEIQRAIFERMKAHETKTHISFEIVNQFHLVNDEKTFNIIDEIMKKFNDSIDISGLIVPAIVYTGPSEDLPTIFYNLNTGGVNLSKYETFSSVWDDTKYKVNDDDIIDKIYEKYDQLRKTSDLEVDISRDEIVEQGVTLFEYCYSISEILRNKNYRIILGANKKSTDPIGFEIISLIMGLDVNKAERLGSKPSVDNRKGALVGASPEFLVELKKMIVDTFDVLVDALEYWIQAVNKTYNTLDSTYMIYHMAISYIHNNYIIDNKNFIIKKAINQNWVSNYKKYLPLYYLKDYISDYWKINRQVSDLTREITNEESLKRYVKNVDMGDWDDCLATFRKNQLDEVATTISLKAKLFLDYLLKYKMSENLALSKYTKDCVIDYEHIVPQKTIENQIGKNNAKSFPVSSVGNLCYLAAKDNRSKRDKTLYEFQEDRPSFAMNEEYQRFIDYPKQDELRFINYDVDKFRNEYREFIAERTDRLINEFRELVERKYN